MGQNLEFMSPKKNDADSARVVHLTGVCKSMQTLNHLDEREVFARIVLRGEEEHSRDGSNPDGAF
jgi:hypothetical protein